MGASICKSVDSTDSHDGGGHIGTALHSDTLVSLSSPASPDGTPAGKGSGKGKPAVTWEYIKSHMNEDHTDSLLAYAIFYAGHHGAKRAILTDVNLEGFFISVEMTNGDKEAVNIPFETDVADVAGVGPVMQSMSKKARNEIFVECASIVSVKVTFGIFNELNKNFNNACNMAEYKNLSAFYTEDAVLIPLSHRGPEPCVPIISGHKAIAEYFSIATEAMLQGIGLKSMRLYQSSDTAVIELGRAWGPTGRSYVRHWQRQGDVWLIQHDSLPIGITSSA